MEVLISSLRKRSQFLRIAQKGRKFSSTGLILQMHKLDKVTDAKIQKGKKIIEVGYTASQKVGSAIYRNKAKRIIEELDKAAKEGKGAAQLDGRMIDAASARMAENIVNIDNLINKK